MKMKEVIRKSSSIARTVQAQGRLYSTNSSSKITANSVQTIQGIETFPENSTIFSLIQPTGKIHIGNYLGAIRGWKDLSDIESTNTKYLFGTADLHAITQPIDGKLLKQYRREAIASLISSGLNPDKCILFHQSSVPEHSELNWYLTCITSMGMLNRMTQWKSKAQQDNTSSIFEDKVLEQTKTGLLCYPVLQAADILIYKSTHVPVGDDQSQHLELTRNIAQSFNHMYKTNFFPIPKTLLTPAKKILSLRNPTKKMSKSDPDQSSCIYVTESPDDIGKKIRRATTDSIQGKVYFDTVERPGVSNLINIVSGLTKRSIEDTVNDLQWINDHKQLKDHVTELIVEEFKPKRHMYEQLLNDEGYLDTICQQGRDKAREIASDNITQLRAIIGLD